MLGQIILAMAIITPTDQTVQVAKGTKLDVNNFAGDVSIKVWDKDAVRVEATHSDREIIDIKPGDQVLTIRSRSVRGGPPRRSTTRSACRNGWPSASAARMPTYRWTASAATSLSKPREATSR